MAYGLFIMNDKSKGKFRMGKSLIAVFVSTYTIYFPMFGKQYSIIGSIFGNLVHTMRVISLDADYIENYTIIRKAIDSEIVFWIYMFVLGTLHIVLPILSAMTAYALIVYWISNVKLNLISFNKKDTYIFSELNEKSKILAADIAKSVDERSNIIFANCFEDNIDLGDGFNRHRLLCIPENITDIKIHFSNKKNIYFLNMTEDNDISDTIRLINRYSGENKELQRRIHIYLFSTKKESETIIDTISKGIIDIRIINENEIACYKLFDEYPLYRGMKNNMISLLILGLNDIGTNILKAALWMGQLAYISLKINIIDNDIENKVSALQLQCPEIFEDKYDINYYDADINTLEGEKVVKEKCADSTYIVICSDLDNDNIRIAMYLRRLFYKVDNGFRNQPVIAVKVQKSQMSNTIMNIATPERSLERKINYKLVPFGSPQKIYTYDELVNSEIEQLAINVHLAYEEIYKELFKSSEPLDINSAIEGYNLYEVNKRSNRANALHIRYKLWLLGLDYIDNDKIEEVNLSDYLTEKRLNKLMIAEHERWMAFLRTEGWITASIEEVKAYQAAGLSKNRHNCPILQMHPYICDFGELSQRAEVLNKENSMIYDKKLVTKIPDILHDKWGISNRKYRIVKKTEKLG